MPVLPTLPVDRLGPIPDVVHQIWVGSEPPAWVRRFWAGWDEFAAEHHPRLTMRRWTDDDLDGTATGRICRRHPGLAPVVIADLLRVEAVSLYGGLYMDSDTIPLRSLDEWTGHRAGWMGQGPYEPDKPPHKQVVNNAAFGFPAHHPYLSAVWDHGTEAVGRGLTSPFHIVGPLVFKKIINSTPELAEAVEIPRGPFPSTDDRVAAREERLGRRLTNGELRDEYPTARVVHMSAVSWQDATGNARRMRRREQWAEC